tara:strand:- start:5 stop:358 length:354 start_codon:yes stop_codon:yes gene_type:complete
VKRRVVVRLDIHRRLKVFDCLLEELKRSRPLSSCHMLFCCSQVDLTQPSVSNSQVGCIADLTRRQCLWRRPIVDSHLQLRLLCHKKDAKEWHQEQSLAGPLHAKSQDPCCLSQEQGR